MRATDQVEEILAKASDAAREGRDLESRKFVRYARSLRPDDPQVLVRWAAEIGDRPEQALYCLQRAVALCGEDPAIEYQAAAVLFDMGEIDSALDLARRARRHIEDDLSLLPGLMSLTGRIADAKDNEQVAEEALTLAVDLEPDQSLHRSTLAEFLERWGRTAEALRVTRAALEQSPDDPALLRLRDRLTGAGR
jgi:tetratricopeptide (TPR) repeat protein